LAGQIGSTDIGLTELEPEIGASGQRPIWLVIYSHARGSTIDNCGGLELDGDYLLGAVDTIVKDTQPDQVKAEEGQVCACPI
jgi:hypothetical protein